jgi:hypothetical protein
MGGGGGVSYPWCLLPAIAATSGGGGGGGRLLSGCGIFSDSTQHSPFKSSEKSCH